MRISDWSADVCSSDLIFGAGDLLRLFMPEIFAADRDLELACGTTEQRSVQVQLHLVERVVVRILAIVAIKRAADRFGGQVGAVEGPPDVKLVNRRQRQFERDDVLAGNVGSRCDRKRVDWGRSVDVSVDPGWIVI